MSPNLIKRIFPTTDQTAPWEGIEFIHEVGTDDLTEALRIRFPQYQFLHERKHAAIIEFLSNELAGMRSNNARQSSVSRSSIVPGSEVAPTNAWGSVQSQNPLSAAHSPASSDCSSGARQNKDSSAVSSAPATRALFVDPAAAMHSTQIIFHATDGRTMKQKSKRRMTDEERLEYKETRKRGACSDCKRVKGKCTHMTDLDKKPNNPSTLPDQFERRISLGTNLYDTKLNKAPKRERASDEANHIPDMSQQYNSNPQQYQSVHTSRRSSNASMRSAPGLNTPPWSATPCDRPEASMSGHDERQWQSMSDTDTGYVLQSHSFDQLQSFVGHEQASSDWSGHNQEHLVPLESMSYFQQDSSFELSQEQAGYPTIQIQGPDHDTYPAPELASLDQWNFVQQHPLDGTAYS